MTKSCTHLVIANNSPKKAAAVTEKVLSALIQGKHIVQYAWLKTLRDQAASNSEIPKENE